MVEREESPKQYPVMLSNSEASLPQRSYLRNFSFCSYFLGRRFFKAMPFRMTCVWVRDSSSLRSSEWHCCHLERMWEISKTCWAAAKHLSLNTPIQEVLHSVRAFLVGDSSLRQCSVQNDMRLGKFFLLRDASSYSHWLSMVYALKDRLLKNLLVFLRKIEDLMFFFIDSLRTEGKKAKTAFSGPDWPRLQR